MSFDDFIKLAPLATATIALCAAILAGVAIWMQRDTARRRAAIDFFLKTETDSELLRTYFAYKKRVPLIPVIISRPTLDDFDKDYQKLRKWLNLCELIAVGINTGAFSCRVAYDYWGYVLPDAYKDCELLIKHIRRKPSLGGPKTFCDLEKIYQSWSRSDDRKFAQ